MSTKVSRFQERLALLIGGGTLLGFGIQQRRVPWGGMVLFGMGCLLLRGGIDWFRSPAHSAPR